MTKMETYSHSHICFYHCILFVLILITISKLNTFPLRYSKRQHERLGRYLTQMFSLLVDVHHKIANLTGNNSLFKCNCGCQLEFFVTSILDKTAKLFLTAYRCIKNATEWQNMKYCLCRAKRLQHIIY